MVLIIQTVSWNSCHMKSTYRRCCSEETIVRNQQVLRLLVGGMVACETIIPDKYGCNFVTPHYYNSIPYPPWSSLLTPHSRSLLRNTITLYSIHHDPRSSLPIIIPANCSCNFHAGNKWESLRPCSSVTVIVEQSLGFTPNYFIVTIG